MTARLVLLLAAVVSLASPNDRAPGREHLKRVRVFADTLLENGIDRYGAVATPAWVSMLDLDTLRIPERKDPLWQRSYDAEDYMRNARGSNLYRDLATVEVFNQLSELTRDPKYGAAASAYLSWFMERCASPKTGLFAWGEHMFYNVVRDELEANRHELERQLPLWELMWRLNPRAVKRGIDAIYDYHIYDKKTFAFDRHGNYYTGLFDDPHVRGAYAKHSGLYAYSFMFLYTKTHEPKYLEWALKAGRMFWEIRHPKTNLIGNVWTPAGNGPTNIPPQLAWYLFRAYQLDRRQTALRDIAVSFVRAYVRAAWDPLSGRFYRDIDVSSAKPTGSYQAPWGDVQGETGFQGQAVVAAYNETKDPEFLVYARRYAQFILNDPVPATVRPETYGKNITFLLELFTTTRDTAYLHAARRYANLAGHTLFKNGLIKESADGYVYNANSGAGEFAQSLLQLVRVERTANAPASTADRFPQFGLVVGSAVANSARSREIRATVADLPAGATVFAEYRDLSGAVGRISPARKAGADYVFKLPAPSQAGARDITVRARIPGRIPWLAFSPPKTVWFSHTGTHQNVQIEGRPVRGVERIPSALLDDTESLPGGVGWVFRVPAGVRGSRLGVVLTAEETASHVFSTFALFRRTGSRWLQLETTSDAAKQTLETDAAPGLYGVSGKPRLAWKLPTDGGLLSSPAVADFLGNRKSLQIALATNDIDRSLHLIDADGRQLWRFPAKAATSTPVLVPLSEGPAVAFSSADTLYLVNGRGQLVWSKTFDAKLTPPAFFRGRLIVGVASGELIVIDTGGTILWRHSISAAPVTTPVVTDLDQDEQPEIIVGSTAAKLHVLTERRGELWSYPARGPRFLAPAVGDITGDGRPEIVFAAKSVSSAHEVVALNAMGQRLWSIDAHKEGEWAPLLADMEGLGFAQVLIQTELQPWPLSELTILDQNGRRIRGIGIPSRVTLIPVAHDFNGDGRLDLLFPCNEDRSMHAFANDGTRLWSFRPYSFFFAGAKMKGGGTPAVADINGDGLLDVITGDDETVLNCIRTDSAVRALAVVSGQFRGSGGHTGQ